MVCSINCCCIALIYNLLIITAKCYIHSQGNQRIIISKFDNFLMNTECAHSKDPESITKSLQGRKIYKDQCVRCFHEPTQPGGLFVCMKCFNGFCATDRDRHTADHGHPLFINIVTTPKNQQQKHEITKLAIGKEGGALDGPEYETSYKVYCSLCKAFEFEGYQQFEPQVQSLANTQSPFKKQAAVSWEVQVNPCEHSLTLQQNPTNKDLSKCVNCELSTNLWLCLTCGNIGCGRANWDGTGGKSHGMKHFQTSHHPLVVKLGTITPEGDASLYCYSCNEDVKDELLPDHLQVLGIQVSRQKKTQKTVTQINIDINLNFSLSRLAEGDKEQSKPMYGPGYTGIDNIGNSCYMNSIIQSLNSLPEVYQQYYKKGEEHLKTCKRIPANCFYCQVSKVFWGLNSGKYSQRQERTKIINEQEHTEEYQQAIKPYDFKLLIADQNAEFNSSHQQDALEYLQWLFDRLEKEEPKYGQVIPKYFSFEATNQLVCLGCNGVKEINQKTNEWKFPVPPPSQKDLEVYYAKLENEKNEELKASKLCEDPDYPLEFGECLNIMRAGDSVEVKCPKCAKNTQFISHHLFKTTPKYLMMIPNRFVIKNFMQKKLNAIISMPEQLDVSQFLLRNSKAKGPLLGEEKKKKYSEDNLTMLVEMGNHRNAAIRALIATNDNLEAACNWIFENYDKDLTAPIQEQEEPSDVKVDSDAVQQITELGFTEDQAKIALLKNKSNAPEAIEWLFNCGGDVSAFADLLKPKKVEKQQKTEEQGPINTKYRLKAVVIHLGKTPTHGHYVAYVRKQGEWVLFNDDVVKIPKQPVLGKGYIYLYESV